MRYIFIVIAGLVIFCGTYAAWWLLNAFACAMATTGCGGFSLAWHDWEALQYFMPTFVAGAALFFYGLWKMFR